MKIDDLIEISRKHDYKDLSCVIDGEIVRLREKSYYGCEIACTFKKLEIDQKNVPFVGARRGKDVLIMLINPCADPSENTEGEQMIYDDMLAYGFKSKDKVLEKFPYYPYNDEYLYIIINEATYFDYCGMDEEEWEEI